MARFETERYKDQAYIIYNELDGVADASYSYVDPSLRGKGVGYYLVKEWHNAMLKNNKEIIGSCGFVQRSLNHINSEEE